MSTQLKHFTFLLAALVIACTPSPPEAAPVEEASQEAEASEATGVELIVVRHSQAWRNIDHPDDMSDEDLDSLTDPGIEQARALGQALAEYPIKAIYASPSGRTKHTAELLREELGLTDAVRLDDRLMFLKGGLTAQGTDASWDWRLEQFALGEDPRPEGGESLADGESRLEAFLATIEEAHPGELVLLVSHGDIVSTILGHARGTPLLERPLTDELPIGAAARIRNQTGTWAFVESP